MAPEIPCGLCSGAVKPKYMQTVKRKDTKEKMLED